MPGEEPAEGTFVMVAVVLKVVAAVCGMLLTLLILMHRGKGGGLSDLFVNGLGASAGTSGVAERNLNRWTVAVALVWIVAIIVIDLL